MKTRIVHTRFWQDSFVCGLSQKEKLLFIYLLTNDRVNLVGIYELPDKYIKADLDLTQPELDQAKNKLSAKVVFLNGWIKIINHDKFNSYQGAKTGIARERELSEVPKEVVEYRRGIDTSIHTSMDTPNNHKSEIINNKYNTLDSLDEKIFKDIADNYNVSVSDVSKVYDQMYSWCKSKGKTYKNYKAALLHWVQIKLEEGKLKVKN